MLTYQTAWLKTHYPAAFMAAVLGNVTTERRELVEETGLEADHWRPVIEMVPSPGFCTERVHVYLATGLREVDRPEAEHEEADMEVARMPFAEAVDAVRNGFRVAFSRASTPGSPKRRAIGAPSLASSVACADSASIVGTGFS